MEPSVTIRTISLIAMPLKKLIVCLALALSGSLSLAQDPQSDPSPNLERAWDAIHADRNEEALKLFDEALGIEKSHDAWFGRGWALNDLDRYPESLEAFEESLRLDPSDTKFRGWRG